MKMSEEPASIGAARCRRASFSMRRRTSRKPLQSDATSRCSILPKATPALGSATFSRRGAGRANSYRSRPVPSIRVDGRRRLLLASASRCREDRRVEAQALTRVLELRSHAVAGGRLRAAGRHRSHLLEPPCRGNILPDAAPPRVRCRRDVAFLFRRIDVPGATPFCSDSGLSIALLSSFLYLCQRRSWDTDAARSHRQAGWNARIPDDGASLDSRDFKRALWRADRQ